MASNAWGLPRPVVPLQAPDRCDKPLKRPGLSPRAARAGHTGIVWFHFAAAALWLFIALMFVAVAAAGRAVPTVVPAISVAAAAGHGLFALVHLSLAAAARWGDAGSRTEVLGLTPSRGDGGLCRVPRTMGTKSAR